MIGLYALGAAHGAPGFFDVGAGNMPRRPIEDYFGSGGCAVITYGSEPHVAILKPKIYGWPGI